MKYLKLFENFVDYSDSKTAVIALVNPEGKVLILQRGSTAPWMPNAWSLVGGGIDNGESPEQAAIRESEEEVGITPDHVSYVKKITTNDIGDIYYFIGHTLDPEVVLDYENQAYKFVSLQDLHDIEFVPYVQDFLVEVLESCGS